MSVNKVQTALIHPDDLTAETREALRTHTGFPVHHAGFLYVPIGQQYLMCEDTAEGERIITAVSDSLSQKSRPVHTLQDAFRHLLTAGEDEQTQMLIRRFGIQQNKPRCVIVFEQTVSDGEPIYLRLSDLAQGNPGEICVEMSPVSMAFIKDMDGIDQDEPAEFSKAVISMAEEETGISLTAGIGGTKASCVFLADSMKEAVLSLRTGKAFRLQGPVYIYQEQALERLLTAVPEKERMKFRSGLLSPDTQRKILNDENKAVIQSFFENDLNLSTTARQLFMHRNTLSYKLDRIEQITGLDLRSFKDAAVFQILMELTDLDQA